jgi:long-chain acyl-CoA synthetase
MDPMPPNPPSPVAQFRASLARRPDAPLILYRDERYTLRDVDRLSDEAALDVAPGERVALCMQNVPEYVVALLALWKRGAIGVPLNPMYKEEERAAILADSGATAVLDRLEYGAARPTPYEPSPDDVAVLQYTSGTTGPPKGAMNTHGNIAFCAAVYRDWIGLTPDDVNLGLAPLFHITGLVAGIAASLAVPMPLVLAGRFEPGAVLEAIERHRATFTVGAITAFIALMNHPAQHDVSSLAKAYSGGAPIAPAVADAVEAWLGSYVHTVYGLTETTSPALAVPYGARSPVDEESGALSVGRVIPETEVRLLEDGELAVRGPGVVPGYWGHAQGIDELATGDVALERGGWFFIVDRKKDQINASGFKVWPREVEDVLYRHPAVREAAVVGAPDAYRGETVKAFVSLRDGTAADPAELIAFCRDRLAVFKAPREVVVLPELPKTATGKILRRELRGS